jgi:acyl-CoA thioesterase II
MAKKPVSAPEPTPLDHLVSLLDLEQIEDNVFRGPHTDENRLRTFGGQVAAQALVAAGRTVVDAEQSSGSKRNASDGPLAAKTVHSLHAYFLRPGDPHRPTVYMVDRIRDGRSFATRRVVAVQHGEPIFNLSASFHVHEDGPSHQRPMPKAPDPESLPTFQERYKQLAHLEWFQRERPIDTRTTAPSLRARRTQIAEPRQQVWLKPVGSLPDDPLLHACIVAYASDMSLLDSILLAHNLSWEDGSMMGMSLDHAMWFHRPFRADQWLLYNQESPSAFGARGLARGEIFTHSGELVVSVVQEGLIRPMKPKAN